MIENPEPEFSYIVQPSELAENEIKHELLVESEACAALAERFGLQAIKNFSAQVKIQRLVREKAIRVSGEIAAEVVQTCVVSMTPVENIISETFEIHFREQSQIDEGETEEIEEFEPFSDDTIDIGEVVSEELALALDPYPRASGIADDVLGPYLPEPEDPETKPFAALAALKRTK
ncbi:MAG: hypothetical protein CMM52_05830 [Rhodospirillaceae bacterium]|nr:hypothetical protein [Rhodospirillaceae bacterium]|tara:strand:+ start:12668 stop:13195 length:528 start_codon:yes stop_codon:yes gene_type:complete